MAIATVKLGIATLLLAAAHLVGASEVCATLPSGCTGDSCARLVVVRANDPDASSSHRIDCLSFFLTTVSPTAVISTVTSYSVDPTATAGQPPTIIQPSLPSITPARTVTPSILPPYVSSSCTATTTPVASQFSSACSCWGVTSATSVLNPHTSTVTATVISPPIYLELIVSNSVPCFSGQKIVDISGGYQGNPVAFDPSSSNGSADNCFYSGSNFVDYQGLDFSAGGFDINLYSYGNRLLLESSSNHVAHYFSADVEVIPCPALTPPGYTCYRVSGVV